MAASLRPADQRRDYRSPRSVAASVSAERWLSLTHGGTEGGWHQRICGSRPVNEMAATILSAFAATQELHRRAFFAAPIEGALAGMSPESYSCDLVLEKVASDSLEDTYRAEFLCWGTVDARRRWLRALARERADNLRLALALQREDGL